jgi:hypothetical protein
MKKIVFACVAFLFIGMLAKAQEKYAVGLFHYNLQYVAGDYKIESRIIKQSVLPTLQFFEKNPKFKSDIEIQGYAVQTFAEEYPEVLTLLKKLVNRGQIELVIAHYSDQFFIGYPAYDMKKSIEINDGILAKNGIQRSRVFFGQELQWTPAEASFLKGKYDLVVTSSDPHSYYRDETLPLVNVHYGNDSILGLIDGKKDLGALKWTYAFLDDGEEFNTLDYNSDFYPVPAQLKTNVDNYKKLLAEGYKFVTISELAGKIKNLKGYKIPDYPFVPEGTWNMSVCGPFMWMGRQRSGVETDGITRALSYQLRSRVLMVQRLIEYSEAKGIDVTEQKKLLEEAWKHLLNSEVSDASGWDPWLVEVQYTANEVADADMILKKITNKLENLVPLEENKTYRLDTKTGNITPEVSEKVNKGTAGYLPIPFAILAKKAITEVRKFSDNLYRLDITCKRPANGAVEITFDTPASGMYYSAGAGEDIAVEIPTDLKHDPAFSLSNGFIYLNNGYSLVKDCSVEHLAATWKMKEQKLVFREELAENNPQMKMRFYIVKGGVNDGLKLGNELNTWPSFTVCKKDNQLTYKKIMPESM